MQFDEPRKYHNAGAYVHAGRFALELGAIWDGVDAAEDVGIELAEIGLALAANWSATTVALAFNNIATLRALITEVQP